MENGEWWILAFSLSRFLAFSLSRLLAFSLSRFLAFSPSCFLAFSLSRFLATIVLANGNDGNFTVNLQTSEVLKTSEVSALTSGASLWYNKIINL
ncbi:MAG: hypothetical protein U9R05_00120 [Chloroflexota bacterium]|nr:hypothetical protein [Chloroflexota bacterium]